MLRIDGLRRVVADLPRSIAFYRGALGFELAAAGATSPPASARLRLGTEYIDLIVGARPPHTPLAAACDPRFAHAAIVAVDMAAAWRRLMAFAPDCITRGPPQRLPVRTGGVTAFKFRDPDGHPLELIHFPSGTGKPRWNDGAAGRATVGVDHVARVVADLDRSIDFYAAFLGLRVTSRGVNRGAAQDRLDGLDGVVVDVVAMQVPGEERSLHLELLAYRTPRPALGAAPASEQGDDGDSLVGLGADASARLVDPDGHRLVLVGAVSPGRGAASRFPSG